MYIPETAKLYVRSPVVEIEGVETFIKDGTKLTVVNEMDRFVVEVDLDGTTAETEEPHADGEPPGESGTITLLALEPRLVLVCEFLGQHGRRHRRLGFLRNAELRRGGIGSTAGTVDRLDRRRPDG